MNVIFLFICQCIVFGTKVLTILSNGSFAYSNYIGCPKRCLCDEDYRTVDCRHRGFTKLPRPLPISAKSLHLDYNNINTIEAEDLRLSNLLHLTLSFNNLSHIKNDTFNHLQSLMDLKLSHNRLSSIDQKLWTNNLNLETIDISYNKLKSFPISAVLKLNRLRSIDLSQNDISYLDAGEQESRGSNINNDGLDFPEISQKFPQETKLLLNISFNKLTIQSAPAMSMICKRLSVIDLSYNQDRNYTTLKQYLRLLKHSKLVYLGLRGLNYLYLPNFLFQDSYFTTHLDLSENWISHLENNSLDSLYRLTTLQLAGNMLSSNPNLTTLRFLEYLDLSNNKIYKLVPEYFPPLLKKLFLSGNKLGTFSPDRFHRLNLLQSLSISNCSLKEVVFKPHSLIRLRSLDISNNNLYRQYLQPIFVYFPNLVRLDLSGNRLQSLWSNFCAEHTNLRFLNLSLNNIPQLFSTNLSAPKLEILDLSWNRISIIFDYQTPHLRELHLQHNVISNIDRDAFTVTSRLHLLDISHNPIRARVVSLWRNVLTRMGPSLKVLKMNSFEIYSYLKNNKWEFFKPFVKLRELQLINCSIEFLPADLENLSPTILKLNLAENEFKMILPTTFLSLKNSLQELDITGNKLEEISPLSLLSLKKLRRLRVAGNPFICDCKSLPDFIDWARETNASIEGLFSYGGEDANIEPKRRDKVVCNRPSNMKGKSLTLLDTSECYAYVDHTPLAAGLSAAFVFLFVASIPYLLGYLVEERRKRKKHNVYQLPMVENRVLENHPASGAERHPLVAGRESAPDTPRASNNGISGDCGGVNRSLLVSHNRESSHPPSVKESEEI